MQQPSVALSASSVLSVRGSLVALAHRPDDPSLLCVADQTGRALLFRPDRPDEEPSVVLDLTERVAGVGLRDAYDERGLLGLAFHPRFGRDGGERRLFALHSAPAEGTPHEGEGDDHVSVLSQFEVGGDGRARDERRLFVARAPTRVHNGGGLLFSADGSLLHLALGDGGPFDEPPDTAQDAENPLGKILAMRVTPGGADPPSIFAKGFRNPWGMTLDDRGRLHSADAGHKGAEEIDAVVAGGNYGWPLREGTIERRRSDAALRPPAFAWTRGQLGLGEVSAAIGGFFLPADPLRYACADFGGRVLLLRRRSEDDVDAWAMERWWRLAEVDGVPEGQRHVKAMWRHPATGRVYALTCSAMGLGGTAHVLELHF